MKHESSASTEEELTPPLADFDNPALQTIIEALPSLVLILDRTGQRVMSNRAADNIFTLPSANNISVEGWINRYHSCHPDGKPIALQEAPVYRALQGEKVQGFECIIKPRRDVEIWLVIDTAPLFNRHGEQVGVFFVAQDVTETKQRERDAQSLIKVMHALSHRHQPAEVAEEIITQSIKLLNSDQAILWQYDEEHDQLNLLAQRNLSAPDLAQIIANVRARQSFSYYVTRHRQTLWQRQIQNVAPELVKSGDFARMMGVQSFVTLPLLFQTKLVGVLNLLWAEEQHDLNPARIEAIERLAQEFAAALYTAQLLHTINLERQRLNTVLNSIPLGVFIVEAPDGRMVMANHAAEVIWGQPLLQVSMVQWVESYSLYNLDGTPVDANTLPLAQVLKTGLPAASAECLIRRKDGSEVIVISYQTPLLDSDGLVIGAVAVLQDLTESKRLLRLEADNLRLQELNHLRTNFLASISHELRTPLSIILGFNELMSQGGTGVLNPAQVKAVSHIQQNAQHLLRLIDNLLELSNLEAARLQFEISEFNPVQVVELAVEAVRSQINRKKQRLEFINNSNLSFVKLDSRHVQQILLQILSNAVKFSPSNGTIKVELATPNAAFWTVTISDQGKGIDSAQQKFIFEKFRQGDEGYSRQAEGLGIGLSIAQQLAHSMGGYIDLISQPGQGSTFRIVLPCAM